MAARKKSTRAKSKPQKPSRKAASDSLSVQIQNILKLAKKNKLYTGIVAVAVILLLLLAFPLRFLLIPAIVNGTPIYSWQYVSELHKSAGNQIINQLISEKLVEQEIAKYQIQVTQLEIDQQVAQLEAQLKETGGSLEAVLALQGMTRDEFIEQLRLNIALERLVKNTIEVSEEDVQTELTENAAEYAELTEQDAATTAAENIRNNRLQESFQAWFNQVRENSSIKNFIPSTTTEAPGVGI